MNSIIDKFFMIKQSQEDVTPPENIEGDDKAKWDMLYNKREELFDLLMKQKQSMHTMLSLVKGITPEDKRNKVYMIIENMKKSHEFYLNSIMKLLV